MLLLKVSRICTVFLGLLDDVMVAEPPLRKVVVTEVEPCGLITKDSSSSINWLASFADQFNDAEPFVPEATGLLLTTSSAKLVELHANKIDMPNTWMTDFLEFFTTQYSTQDAAHLRLLSLCLTFEQIG